MTGRNHILTGRNHISTGRNRISTSRNHILIGRNHISIGRKHVLTGSKRRATGSNHVTTRSRHTLTGSNHTTTGSKHSTTSRIVEGKAETLERRVGKFLTAQGSGGLTPRAPDGWESARFSAYFWLEVGSGKMASPRPAHPRVTHPVGRQAFFLRWVGGQSKQIVKVKSVRLACHVGLARLVASEQGA